MKNHRTERGQSLVELAVSLLVLLYLLSGAAEFGVAFFQYVQLRDAAQEGALYGSLNACAGAAAIETRVRGASYTPIKLNDPGSGVTVTITAKSAGGAALSDVTAAREGDAITVSVKYDHKIFMPFMAKFIGPTITLNGSVTDTVLAPIQGSSC